MSQALAYTLLFCGYALASSGCAMLALTHLLGPR